MREISVFECGHCRRLFRTSRGCENHEKTCAKNPDNHRPCIACSNLTKRNVTVYDDPYGTGEYERKVSLLYCQKLNKFLYPPKVEAKGNAFETDPLPNEPMPKQCEVFDSETSLEDIFKITS